jgi:hypothetical protein
VCPATLAPARVLGDPHVSSGRSYARRKPEESDLYQIVQQELETFLAGASARERPVPRFVARELRAFLRCGILAYGFVRALRRLRTRSCRRVRWVPGALPARAGFQALAEPGVHLRYAQLRDGS